jgi:hypothetical protein
MICKSRNLKEGVWKMMIKKTGHKAVLSGFLN